MTAPANVRRTRAGSGERGVSAVLVALLLTVLMSAAAFAVDLGAVFTERRHDQNTADAAAMSAAVEAVIGGGVIDDVVEEVRDKVDTTLGRTVTAEEWEACADPEQLTYTTRELQSGNPTISPVTDCISFSAAFERVRVRLPDQQVQAVFSEALGFGSLQTTAAAEAEVVAPGSGAPPFVALSTATQGDFVCLRTSDNPQPQTLLNGMGPGVAPVAGTRADPCDSTVYDTSSENYGTLQPYRYLDGCTQQNADVEVAISIGIDHIMGFFENGFSGTLGVVNDDDRVDGGASCTVAFPNTFAIDTGFNAQGLRCALISLKNADLCNDEVPRFHQGAYVQNDHEFADEKMDNEAPWTFMRDADELYQDWASDACVVLADSRPGDDTMEPLEDNGIATYDHPTSFNSDGTVTGYTTIDLSTVDDSHWDHYDRYDLLIECLETWTSGTDPELFTEDLGLSPRFAFIPKVAEGDLDKVSYVHIESFLPTFMYRLYQSTSSGGDPCDPIDPRSSVPFYTHDAGQQFDCGEENSNVDRLSSIMFSCGMVPDALCNKETGNPPDAGQDIYDFRLVK